VDQHWLEDVLPTLTDAEAFAAVAARGLRASDELAAHLPRLAAAFLSEGDGPFRLDQEAAALALLGGGALDVQDAPDPLVAAVDRILPALLVGGGQDVVLATDGDGRVRVTVLLDSVRPWGLADALDRPDRYAVLTTRFGAPHVLLGDVTGRFDVVLCRVRGDERTGWRDHAGPAARRFAALLHDHVAGRLDPPRVTLSVDDDPDWFLALEHGRVDEGQDDAAWEELAGVEILHDDARAVGFRIRDFSEFDPEAHPEVWRGPRFHAPLLGLSAATVGEVVTAWRGTYGEGRTPNREAFHDGIAAEGQDALGAWHACLFAGDSMAHYALGYTFLELGETALAYRHLRFYTEIAPREAWAWCYRGQAAAARGDDDEARDCLLHAVALEREGETATDAPTHLAALVDVGALERRLDEAVRALGRPVLVGWADGVTQSALLDLDGMPLVVRVEADGVVVVRAIGAVQVDDGTHLGDLERHDHPGLLLRLTDDGQVVLDLAVAEDGALEADVRRLVVAGGPLRDDLGDRGVRVPTAAELAAELGDEGRRDA
jgi:hypothetical protein